MHVFVASVSAATSPSGVCRHAANVVRGLLADPSVRVTLAIGEWQADYFRTALGLSHVRLDLHVVSMPNNSLTRNLWYLCGLPLAARTRRADILHLAFPMPLLRAAFAVPVVVSLHDLYAFEVPENFGRHRAHLNRAALRFSLRNGDAITCVSEETHTRAHQIYPKLDHGKTVVIPNSVHLSGVVRTALPESIANCPFLLCVAQHRANKNLPLLLRTFRLALDKQIVPPLTKLVLVGNRGPETPALNRIIAECNLSDRLVFLHGISDGLLTTLYARCDLLVAPSLLEGFGLPVAEGLAAGCRVVCSDISAFRALESAHMVFFDPLDETGSSLLNALRCALNKPRRAPGSSMLTPRKAAEMYLALYSKLLLRTPTHSFQPAPADLTASGGS